MSHFKPRQDAEWHHGRRIVPTNADTKWIGSMDELRKAGGVIHFNEDQTEIYLSLPEGHKFSIMFPRHKGD